MSLNLKGSSVPIAPQRSQRSAGQALNSKLLVKSGQIWSNLVISGHFWSFLVISGHFWSNLVKSGQFWSNLDKSGQI